MSKIYASAFRLAVLGCLFASPAVAQTFMPMPPGTVMGNLGTQANAGNAVDIPHLIIALAAGGIPLDQMTKVGDTTYTILSTDRAVGTTAALTASRTWSLPAASSVTAGHPIVVVDLAGGIAGANTIVVARAGSDTINGGTTATITAAYGALYLISDGVSRWVAQLMATTAAPVTSVTCGTGLSGGTITTSGTCAVALTNLANSISGDVALNNTANYFDGPTVAQGTTGTWFASGCVSLQDTAGAARFFVKLWDGTTVIASAVMQANAGSVPQDMCVSGILASPAANIRISVRDSSSTSGSILFNTTGNSKDSTVTAFRIQ